MNRLRGAVAAAVASTAGRRRASFSSSAVGRRPLATLSLADVDAAIAATPVVAVTKSYCPFCRDVVERLEDAGIEHRVIALDAFENGNAVRDELKARTGDAYVPFCFVRGGHVPGESFVESLRVPTGSPVGTRPPLVLRAGLHAPGFFRP